MFDTSEAVSKWGLEIYFRQEALGKDRYFSQLFRFKLLSIFRQHLFDIPPLSETREQGIIEPVQTIFEQLHTRATPKSGGRHS
jgi:hypothetical protein